MRENDGSVMLCIDLKNGEFDNNANVNIRLNTVNGSANCKPSHRISAAIIFFFLLFLASLDFKNETTLLTFTRVGTMRTVNLSIIDDNVFEANETFTGVLELVDNSRIILQPNTTQVSIVLDNDSKYIEI